MKQPPKHRKIYDQNYYKAQAILRDPWFIKKAIWLKELMGSATIYFNQN